MDWPRRTAGHPRQTQGEIHVKEDTGLMCLICTCTLQSHSDFHLGLCDVHVHVWLFAAKGVVVHYMYMYMYMVIHMYIVYFTKHDFGRY